MLARVRSTGVVSAQRISSAVPRSPSRSTPSSLRPRVRVPVYRVLVADPGWAPDDSLGKRGAEAHYKNVETLADIMRHPIPHMAENSVLFLWRVAIMVEEAYGVARAWGFEPNKGEMVWAKMTKCGKRHFGMGYIVRGSHEVCLIATRGKPLIRHHSQRSLFEAPMPYDENGKIIHSAKPDEFFRIVAGLYDGPRASIYERKRRDGFDCFGNELV